MCTLLRSHGCMHPSQSATPSHPLHRKFPKLPARRCTRCCRAASTPRAPFGRGGTGPVAGGGAMESRGTGEEVRYEGGVVQVLLDRQPVGHCTSCLCPIPAMLEHPFRYRFCSSLSPPTHLHQVVEDDGWAQRDAAALNRARRRLRVKRVQGLSVARYGMQRSAAVHGVQPAEAARSSAHQLWLQAGWWTVALLQPTGGSNALKSGSAMLWHCQPWQSSPG